MTSPLIGGHTAERLKSLLRAFIQDGRFSDPLVEKLLNVDGRITTLSLKSQIIEISEIVGFFTRVRSHVAGEQYRANVLKLIGLADEFEDTQPETLSAMGISGKHLLTFISWLNELSAEVDEQALPDPLAENAITFKTWHASKGLEWPVVVILEAEKALEPGLPDIGMAYPSGSLEAMMTDGFVQYLPQFNDPRTQENMLDLIRESEDETRRNLFYVALTRAREQIIIPHWEKFADNSMLSAVQPSIDAILDKGDATLGVSQIVPGGAGDALKKRVTNASRHYVQIDHRDCPIKILDTLNPSTIEHKSTGGHSSHSESVYATGLDLTSLGSIPANEIGTWVHKVYETYFSNPELLTVALDMGVGGTASTELKAAFVDHLDRLKALFISQTGTDSNFNCEVPILGINEAGQVLSGTLDLLIESATGNWVVDHKTDTDMSEETHIAQLLAYRQLSANIDISHFAINWSRHGVLCDFKDLAGH